MADISFEWGSDERDVTRSIRAMGKETGQLRQMISDLAQTTRQQGEAEVQIAGQRLQALNKLTEQQTELRRMADRLKQDLSEGKISAEEYGRSFDKIGREGKQLNEQLRKLGAEVREDSADMQKAIAVNRRYETSTERVGREVAELNRLRQRGFLTETQHRRAIEATERQLEKSAVSGRKFSGTLTAAGVAGGAMIATLQQVGAELRTLRSEMADTVTEADTLFRKFQIQSGLTDAERMQAGRQVGGVALDAGVTLEKAFRTATQLSSSGFADPVAGGALDTALALMQSSNQIEGNEEDFVKGSAQFLAAFGRDKNQANLVDLGVRVQGLFKSTDVQVPDLSEFAKAAPTLSKAGVSLEDSLSLLTALRETMSAGEAATGVRNVVGIMQTAGVKRRSRAALEQIGIAPDAIDMQGESPAEALRRLRNATGNMAPAERAQVLMPIFGRENIGAAQILMQSADRLGTFSGMQREAAGAFFRDTQTARSGMQAAANRAEVSDQLDQLRHADFIERQEALRQSRVNIRRRAVREAAADGTVGGSMKAALLQFGGMVDDNVRFPITGEYELGRGHAVEADRIQSAGSQAGGFTIQLPPEMRQQIERGNAILERIAQQQRGKQQAGNVAGRNMNQLEGAN